MLRTLLYENPSQCVFTESCGSGLETARCPRVLRCIASFKDFETLTYAGL